MDRQEPALKAEHLTGNSKLLSNLSRYESRHRRAYDRAVEKLESQEKTVVRKNEPSCDTEKAAA
jgi:hypothetical protein